VQGGTCFRNCAPLPRRKLTVAVGFLPSDEELVSYSHFSSGGASGQSC
jgi:hypothetical protein